MHRLLQSAPLRLAQLPPAVEGLRAAHLTDLHIRKPRKRYQQIIDALRDAQPDLGLLTGDYMSVAGDEAAAFDQLKKIVESVAPRLGWVGVFGNHDTPALIQQAMGLPVRWLIDQAHALADLPITLTGCHMDQLGPPDPVAALLDERRVKRAGDLRLGLMHHPGHAQPLIDAGLDAVFCGHTHGGQMRPPGRLPLINACDLPLHLSAGLLRQGRTTLCIARGAGEVLVDLRFFCPPHVPVYTFEAGPPCERVASLSCIERW